MDTSTLIVELTKAAAWPLASIVLALMVRGPVTSLLQGIKLKRLKRGEWEADFQETFVEVRREVAALGPVPVGAAAEGPRAVALPVLAADKGASAEAMAWDLLEASIDGVAKEAGVSASTLAEKLRALADRGLLQTGTVDAINGLRVLRNLSVHAPEPVPPEKTREFVEMANAVIFAVMMNVKHAKKRTQ